MSSNQLKAYDHVLIAGQAARERIRRKLIGFDESHLVEVGRPQVDVHTPPGRPCPTTTAPSCSTRPRPRATCRACATRRWPATACRSSARCSPSPASGSSTGHTRGSASPWPSYRAAHEEVLGLIREANAADAGAHHLADTDRAVRLAGRRGRRLHHRHLRGRLRLARDGQAARRDPPGRAARRAARVGSGARARPARRLGCRACAPRSSRRRSPPRRRACRPGAALLRRHHSRGQHGPLPGGLLGDRRAARGRPARPRLGRGRPRVGSRSSVGNDATSGDPTRRVACSRPPRPRVRGWRSPWSAW